jgi:hypothetical protein
MGALATGDPVRADNWVAADAHGRHRMLELGGAGAPPVGCNRFLT